MFFFSSPAARTSLIYITFGALTLIWTTVWWIFLANNPPESGNVYYWLGGFMATGVITLLIGFGLGRIGREAHKAEIEVKAAPAVAVQTTPAVVQPVPAATVPSPVAVVTTPSANVIPQAGTPRPV